ncbi:hypothetical protein VN97_g810 [Penicillium thymicola]|uniref:Uncharacterized protein n=1 Tax=Penicillium thymicola TaxID=293382 RepID=A0AAI9TS52_PENTH|nr:hypothetical protein VN97_g810 [Penicillium thymicola]
MLYILCSYFNVKSQAVHPPTVVKNISDVTKRNIVEVIFEHVLFVTASFLAVTVFGVILVVIMKTPDALSLAPHRPA